MKWFFPSWNGDLRLEPEEGNAKHTRLSVVKPTAHEQLVLAGLEKVFREKGWWKGDDPLYSPPKSSWLRKAQTMTHVTIAASLQEIGPLVAAHAKPGQGTLTAVRFEDGKVIAVEGVGTELGAAMKAAMGLEETPAALPPSPSPEPPPRKEEPPAKAEVKSDPPPPEPAAAATVKRATPCCPQCIEGAVEPATEVLLSFLTDEQHAMWAKERCLIAEGGLTGVRYLLAHRHTARAQKFGRVCYSIDDDSVVHFHQTEVPPEEEILSAMLILQHREPWLRNEATMLGESGAAPVFKNPFGGGEDGMPDAQFMRTMGRMLGFQDAITKRKRGIPIGSFTITNG